MNGEVRVFEALPDGIRVEVHSRTLDEATLLEIAASVTYDPTRDH